MLPKSSNVSRKEWPRVMIINSQNNLRNVLRAYAKFNPELGYCQGMGMIVGLLLMIMKPEVPLLIGNFLDAGSNFGEVCPRIPFEFSLRLES